MTLDYQLMMTSVPVGKCKTPDSKICVLGNPGVGKSGESLVGSSLCVMCETVSLPGRI